MDIMTPGVITAHGPGVREMPVTRLRTRRRAGRWVVLLLLLIVTLAVAFRLRNTGVFTTEPIAPKFRPTLSQLVDQHKISPSEPAPGTLTPSPGTAVNDSRANATSTPALEYEFVVAHYNEKLDWLRPLANHSHVYHKGKDKGPPFDVYKWEKLPNVGRESHTYLHHIIHNYDNLADLTVFLQGTGPFKDPHWCFPTPMDFVQHAKKKEYCKITQTYGGWTRLRHVSKWLKMLQRGEMRRANLTTGEFYQAVFGTPHPDTVPVCLTACFSASRENLRRFPVSLYERAISFVNDHSNPEEGHYLERLWATIANAKRNP